jgi:hypothetical protein
MYLQRRAQFREVVEQFIRANSLDMDAGKLAYGELTLLPGHVLYPLNWRDNIHRQYLAEAARRNILPSLEEARRLFPGSLAVTWWAHSWGD